MLNNRLNQLAVVTCVGKKSDPYWVSFNESTFF